jgi:hypothetical protein
MMKQRQAIESETRREARKHREARESGHALRYTLKTGVKKLIHPGENERRKARRSARPRPDVMDDPGSQMTG